MYYLRIAKSGSNVIRGVFGTYFIYSFSKDNICCCLFTRRSAAVAEIFADFFSTV